jgi:hypothetical protein
VLVAGFENTTADPVFDGTLTQALTIDLEQLPFLSIVSRDGVHQTLSLMTRSPDDRVVARRRNTRGSRRLPRQPRDKSKIVYNPPL